MTGFIDYIVQPTLTVLGDTLDTMMAQLKGEERKPSSENGPGMAATKDSASGDASKGQSGSESAPITNTDPIHRPWTEILPINRSKWQESADKGESILISRLEHLIFWFLIEPVNKTRVCFGIQDVPYLYIL